MSGLDDGREMTRGGGTLYSNSYLIDPVRLVYFIRIPRSGGARVINFEGVAMGFVGDPRMT